MSRKYTDRSQVAWGNHKPTPLSEIPPEYLLKVYKEKKPENKKLITYIEANLEKIKARMEEQLKAGAEAEDKAAEVAAVEEAKKTVIIVDKTVGRKRVRKIICRETEKIAFPAEKDAKAEIRRIRGVDQDHKKPVRAYECLKCSGWHLTSIPFEEWEKHKDEESGNWYFYSKAMLKDYAADMERLTNQVEHLKKQMDLLREDNAQLRTTVKEFKKNRRELTSEGKTEKRILLLEKELLSKRTEIENLKKANTELVARLFLLEGKKKS